MLDYPFARFSQLPILIPQLLLEVHLSLPLLLEHLRGDPILHGSHLLYGFDGRQTNLVLILPHYLQGAVILGYEKFSLGSPMVGKLIKLVNLFIGILLELMTATHGLGCCLELKFKLSLLRLQ